MLVPDASAPSTLAAPVVLRPGLPFAFDFEMIVRDLIYQRAWTESGGEEADTAIQEGKPVPTDRPRNRLDLAEALRLREEQGMTYREIGAFLGVSGAAVYLALKKRADNAPPAVKTRRKK
ncbi:hypothetical protein LP417_33045 (plasmid) [Polaromonas sp. P1-6]|nr:hypothetical protein LP417_33045 [Polaromonas sp. P1-6]